MKTTLSALHSTQASDQFASRSGVYEWLHGHTKRRVNKDTNNWQVKKGELLSIQMLL
jgi:hypothetical protein